MHQFTLRNVLRWSFRGSRRPFPQLDCMPWTSDESIISEIQPINKDENYVVNSFFMRTVNETQILQWPAKSVNRDSASWIAMVQLSIRCLIPVTETNLLSGIVKFVWGCRERKSRSRTEISYVAGNWAAYSPTVFRTSSPIQSIICPI